MESFGGDPVEEETEAMGDIAVVVDALFEGGLPFSEGHPEGLTLISEREPTEGFGHGVVGGIEECLCGQEFYGLHAAYRLGTKGVTYGHSRVWLGDV